MKIGIISDSHDDVTNVNRAIDILIEKKIRSVIHAGDIISPPIIKEFKRLTDDGVSFFGIYGNNDGEKKGLEVAFNFVKGNLLGDDGKFEIDGLNFCVYHGQDLRKKEKFIRSQKFDVFIYGHSHTKHSEISHGNKRDTIILNPGSSHSQAETKCSESPYFPQPSIIIFDSTTKEIEFIDL